MHTDLGNKIATLLENHNALTALIESDRFNGLAADTQLKLLNLHREVDATMNAINAQVDAIDLKIADMFYALNL
ncbi:hypothetical protein [Methylococcus geothermalis]|uniref:Uncharacterized protein n=1 Tax=Methylococcus geothermalis TaxID=2681310 RepID=A0A858QAW0_9GAMM|nr:hypothetical protein [Methylococcus geothermalis]QJD31028.1 hypothetical protein GNH96_14460 [Methylococcus geothermalis]